MDFPTGMKKKRIELGLTQKQFAKKAETSQQMIVNYEKGYVEPSYRKFLMICKLLKLDPNSFMEVGK